MNEWIDDLDNMMIMMTMKAVKMKTKIKMKKTIL